MVLAVERVADVVHPAGYCAELDGAFVEARFFEYVGGGLGYVADVPHAVLGIAQIFEIELLLFDERFELVVGFHVFQRYFPVFHNLPPARLFIIIRL